MSITYTRAETAPNWLKMKHMEVQVWNILSSGPLNAWEIHRRLHGSDYNEIIGVLADMNRAGLVLAHYSH